MEGPSGYKRGGRTPGRTLKSQRERKSGGALFGEWQVSTAHAKKIGHWPALPCPALSGQVAFKVTYVGVSYESSAIIKESHSACPTAPCPAARFQPGAIISKRHACQQHSKLLCGLMVFSWLLLANTYLYMLYTFLLVSQQQPLLLTLVTWVSEWWADEESPREIIYLTLPYRLHAAAPVSYPPSLLLTKLTHSRFYWCGESLDIARPVE